MHIQQSIEAQTGQNKMPNIKIRIGKHGVMMCECLFKMDDVANVSCTFHGSFQWFSTCSGLAACVLLQLLLLSACCSPPPIIHKYCMAPSCALCSYGARSKITLCMCHHVNWPNCIPLFSSVSGRCFCFPLSPYLSFVWFIPSFYLSACSSVPPSFVPLHHRCRRHHGHHAQPFTPAVSFIISFVACT